MSLLAALDLGTNSFHLVIARMSETGFEIVTRHKETVRLGHGAGDMKVLEPDAIERGLAALQRMRRLAESAGAPLRAVATSAVREAENAEAFIDRALAEAGVEVEVISGVEEARLIHLGILQAVPVYDQRLIMCDIGGGSTEVLVGERGEVLTSRSFKLGAVRLTDRFFPGGKVRPEAVAECRHFVRSSLTPLEREVSQHGFQVAVGSSGTIESVAKIAHALGGGAPLRTYNCFEFTRSDLQAVLKALTAAPTTEQRRQVPGIEPERADILVAGALILAGVFDTFGIKRMQISENALREGVLLDTALRQRGGVWHHLDDVSRRGCAISSSSATTTRLTPSRSPCSRSSCSMRPTACTDWGRTHGTTSRRERCWPTSGS
ncbi:MAG: Ppx/GppA phosphatase family protein [Ilumatobacteraceae bacterium]